MNWQRLFNVVLEGWNLLSPLFRAGGESTAILDRKFGEALPPFGSQGGIKNHEKDSDSNIIKNPEFQTIKPGSTPILDTNKEYIWVINEYGKLIIGVETPMDTEVNTKNGYIPKLGHPTLTDGKNARISGELRYINNKWIINNKSGRYTIHYYRRIEHLQNVADLLKKAGLSVESKFTAF
jgi:hypothetical protein